MSGPRRTIRVHLVVNSLGQVGCALLRQEFRGPRRLDCRLMSMRPVPSADPTPRGVDPDLWLAYCALRDRVVEARAAAGEVTGH